MPDINRYIRFDWAAKRMLRDKANFSVLEGLITVLLNQEVRIQEILESEGNKGQEDSKFNRVDVMAKNSKGELIIVEIQLSRQVHYLERILFGASKAVSDHIYSGEPFRKVKKVYSISILYFDFGKGDDYVYHGETIFRGIHTGDTFELSERDRELFRMRGPEEIFPEYYLIRVNEFNKVASTPLEEWLEYLKTGKVREGTTTPGLREAKEKLNYMLMEDRERRAYEHYLDSLIIEEDCLETAKIEGHAEGLAEGIEKGHAEGHEKGLAEGLEKGLAEGLEKGLAEGIEKGEKNAKVEMAKSLKKLNVSNDIISSTTGLTVPEIEKL